MVNVVMNKGVLLDAIFRTADRACRPTLCGDIASFFAFVASRKSARSISTASVCCCQTWNPREQSSMASVRYGEVSSCR